MAETSSRQGMADRVLAGDRRALARLLTYVENDEPLGQQSLDRLFPHTGRAHLVGITGPPGGGKSTLVNELIRAYRQRGARIAVIAVDPSSPLSGGATLGDRIRMLEWHDDPDVFIRSMASRRFGGGLAQNALAVAHVFDAAGFDPVIIETVGTGQDEVAIASLAMTTLLVQVPGMGDGVQTLKAGALEIGDVLVVTKADRPEADELARDLRRLRQMAIAAGGPVGGWEAPVVKTSAMRREGIGELVEAIDRHRAWLRESGALAERERTILSTEVTMRVQAALLRRIAQTGDADGALHGLIDRVVARDVAPHRAAEELLGRMRTGG